MRINLKNNLLIPYYFLQMANFDDGVDDGQMMVSAVTPELPEIRLFNKWSLDDVQTSDMSLQVTLNLL